MNNIQNIIENKLLEDIELSLKWFEFHLNRKYNDRMYNQYIYMKQYYLKCERKIKIWKINI